MAVPEYQAIVAVAQTQIRYMSDGQRIQNDVHWHRDGGWSESDLGAVNAAVLAWYNAVMKPLLPPEIALTEIISTDLTSLAGARVVEQLPAPISGTSADPGMPLNVTIAVKLSTNTRGRGRSGRLYWPQLNHSQVDIDEVTDPAATAIVNAYISLQNDVEAALASTTMCIAHRYENGVKIFPGAHTPVTAMTLTDKILDSQRDRLPGHKRHKKRRVV